MNWLDIVIIVTMGIAALMGYRTGVIKGFLSIIGIIVGVVLAGQFGDACVFYTLIQSREYGFKNYWVEDAILYQTRSLKNVMPPLIGSRWAKLTNARQLDSVFG